MGKTFVMGDIHGNHRALIQCLTRSGFNNLEDRLIQLGDVADGWPETSECVDTLLSIRDLVTVRGNHDVWMYDWFKHGYQPILWTEQGGQATIDSYKSTGMILNKEHQAFWEDQLNWYLDEQNNNLYIHAGWNYVEGWPLGALSEVNAGSIAKECHWNRSLWRSAQAAYSHKGTFKALAQFNEIYIGHTADAKLVPENCFNIWNIDTGAGWHGKLTIMDVDTKEYWQSDLGEDLYPEVRGRGGRISSLMSMKRRL